MTTQYNIDDVGYYIPKDLVYLQNGQIVDDDTAGTIERIEKLLPKRDGKFVCLLCPKAWLQKASMITHLLKQHNYEADKKELDRMGFLCLWNGCGKYLTTWRQLICHVYHMHLLRGYACDKCLLLSATKSGLNHHKNTVHNDERNYHCTFVDCSSSFKRQSDLNHHENTFHNDERNYHCTFVDCSSSFKR